MMALRTIQSISGVAVAIGLSLTLILPSLALGGTIEIEFTGVDIGYGGTDIVDQDPFSGDPDPLTSVVITEDGVLAGPILTSSISQDLYIPQVTSISAAGGSTLSAAGGSLLLQLGSGSHLDLDLGQVDINYVDLNGAVQFVFAATVGGVSAQSLPYGLEVGQHLGVSFQTQVSPASLTTSGGIVTGFTASGTGDVRGAAVPEPTCLVLWTLAIAGACILGYRQK